MSRSDWQTSRPLVVDTNTVLSALVGGVTRTLVLELDRDLRYPEPSYDEIRRNRDVVRERARISPTTVDELVETVFENITLVPEPVILRNYDEAAGATSPHPDADPRRTFVERDEGDVVFLAAALAVDGAIWSDDGVFPTRTTSRGSRRPTSSSTRTSNCERSVPAVQSPDTLVAVQRPRARADSIDRKSSMWS